MTWLLLTLAAVLVLLYCANRWPTSTLVVYLALAFLLFTGAVGSLLFRGSV